MVKRKIFYSVLTALCLLAMFSYALSFVSRENAIAFADTKDYSIVFDDYDGADMTVSRYERVTVPTATFSERNVKIGKAEVCVYDEEQNLVSPYRKGDYLFTETGEYSVVYRPIGYFARGVDGGDKNLSFNITVSDGDMPSEVIFPEDNDIAAGLLCDYNESFYLTDAFLDYANAGIYLSEFPEVLSEEIADGNNALKLVKNSGYAKAGLYFGAQIEDEITDFSFISVKIKTDATEVYFANLSNTAFYKMEDLSAMTLGDFSYGEDDYQTVYLSAKALKLDENSAGIQIVFNGAAGAFVAIDEIGFIADRKDYKFITSLKEMSIVESDSVAIDMSVYLNGVKISAPVFDYEIPVEYESFASVISSDDKFVFNALSSGNAVLRVNYYDNGTLLATSDIVIRIKSFEEAASELVSTLKDNEIVNWSSVKYKYVLQKSTVSGYTDDFDASTKINVGYNARYYNNGYGASTIIFPERKAYTDGYLRIRCIFDNYNASRVVKIYKYGETDATKTVATYSVASATMGGESGKYYDWYIPVVKLLDDNGVLNGIQIINSSNWMNLGMMYYVPEDEHVPNYVIYDNISDLALYENGETRAVSVYLEMDGIALDNSDFYIELESSASNVLRVDDLSVTPLNAGAATLTVRYYKDALKTELLAQKQKEIIVDTVENVLSATLTGGQLAIWDNILYETLVSDTTVSGRSMVNETYDAYVNPNKPLSGYFYDFVPAGGNGSGRTITFPVQNEYTEGYLKITLTAQNGNFNPWTFIEIYKVGETNVNNYVVKATGSNALSGVHTIDIYVPVEFLTNEQGVLTGVQILAAGLGWLRIETIEYVEQSEYTPTYSVSDNLSAISVAEGGGAQTVNAALIYDEMTVGAAFVYTASLHSDDESVATVSGMQIVPVSSGDVDVTVTLKDGQGNILASDTKAITVKPLSETLASTLTEGQLVNWNTTLYENMVSDTTVAGRSMASETYTPFISAYDASSGYYDFVPAGGNGSGRTITFPEQKVYTDGYVKFKFVNQSGNFPAWAFIEIYKYGETSASNCALKVTGNDAELNNQQTAYVYVPVSSLTDADGVLRGVQILAAGTGWFQIWNIDYVAEIV